MPKNAEGKAYVFLKYCNPARICVLKVKSLRKDFTYCSGISIVDFEQVVNASWENGMKKKLTTLYFK